LLAFLRDKLFRRLGRSLCVVLRVIGVWCKK
jgi:hypothetical protein